MSLQFVKAAWWPRAATPGLLGLLLRHKIFKRQNTFWFDIDIDIWYSTWNYFWSCLSDKNQPLHIFIGGNFRIVSAACIRVHLHYIRVGVHMLSNSCFTDWNFIFPSTNQKLMRTSLQIIICHKHCFIHIIQYIYIFVLFIRTFNILNKMYNFFP
jgi:hypothetical protein